MARAVVRKPRAQCLEQPRSFLYQVGTLALSKTGDGLAGLRGAAMALTMKHAQ